MMKSVRKLLLSMAITGIAAVPMYAQTGADYQTSRFSQPAMLPDYTGASQVVPQVIPTSGGYMMAARRGNGPEVVDAPEMAPQAAPSQSIMASPSDIHAAPAITSSGAPCATGNCGNGYGSVGGNSGLYADQGAYAGACDAGYVGCGYAAPSWSVYIGGIYMSRTNSNKKWTSYETNNNPNQTMYYPDSDEGFGPEVAITKFLGCDSTRGIQGVYYGFTGMGGYDAEHSQQNLISSPMDLGFVNFDGAPASTYFDNSRDHRVWREDEFHNVEVNYIHYLVGSGCQTCACQPYSFAWLTGFRFIKFSDNILWGASQANYDWGVDGSRQGYLTTEVDNHLYGWQIGAMFQHNFSCNWSWYATPKVGIFGNSMDFHTCGYTGDGDRAVFTATGNQFDLRSSTNGFSMLGQIDLGLTYRINNCWSVTGGYRALAITGIALADDQVPHYMAAENDWTDIDKSSSVILHGAFFGVQRCW
jgi:hypothetical protein